MSSNREILLPIYDRRPQDHCGVVAITDTENASRETFFALYALQHRGQESAGISASDGRQIRTHEEMGPVSAIFREEDISRLEGNKAIGHTRYSTSGGSRPDLTQPVNDDPELALAHNGNITLTKAMEDFADEKAIPRNGDNDTKMMYRTINYFRRSGASLAEAVALAYDKFGKGVFACAAMTKDEMVVFQDPCAMKPLSIGKLNGGYAAASETCALDTINADFIRDVEPGELVEFKKGELRSHQLGEPDRKRDSWEFVYFARPDSVIDGRSVYTSREKAGILLAKESPVEADVVIPVLDSGTPSATGYAFESGIRYREALTKNRYIGRTFILPDQRIRDIGVQLKHNPIKELIKDQRVVLVDDSIVRGTTTPKLVKMLRDVGAAEVHLRIAAPPYKFPDFYGTDTPIQSPLVASHMSIDEIRAMTGADSLGYLSYPGLLEAINLPEDQLSTSWYTGIYPVPVPCQFD